MLFEGFGHAQLDSSAGNWPVHFPFCYYVEPIGSGCRLGPQGGIAGEASGLSVAGGVSDIDVVEDR